MTTPHLAELAVGNGITLELFLCVYLSPRQGLGVNGTLGLLVSLSPQSKGNVGGVGKDRNSLFQGHGSLPGWGSGTHPH